MSPMDHAEAHERIADLAIEPGRLSAMTGSGAAGDQALLAHIATCRDCSAEIAAWRGVHDALDAALRTASGPGGVNAGGRATVEPIRAPTALRESVLRATRRASPAIGTVAVSRVAEARPAESRPAGAGKRWSWGPALLGLAAVIAVLVVGAAAYRIQDDRVQAVAAQQRQLATVTAALDRVLASDVHVILPLHRSDGSTSGSISWSRQDLVVLTSGLAPPPAGTEYRCWLENGGKRTPIGRMAFAGSVAFWAASLDDWATVAVGPATSFGISLETIGGPGGSPAILKTTLHS